LAAPAPSSGGVTRTGVSEAVRPMVHPLEQTPERERLSAHLGATAGIIAPFTAGEGRRAR
jgi:hypothetical protein